MNLYKMRRRRNAAAMVLSLGATVFGLGWLVLILAVLLWKGIAGLNVQVFTEMTPPPGSAGGLLNPIIGSLIFTTLAVLTGTPIGILAGTYMDWSQKIGPLPTGIERLILDALQQH